MKIVFEIIKDILCNVTYFIKSNLRNFATLLDILLPYAMYIIGQCVHNQRNKIDFGFEILIPIIICIVIYFIRSYANKIGKGTTIPIPNKRFTEIEENGEVLISNNRVQELILYMADLEDWLERKGLL